MRVLAINISCLTIPPMAEINVAKHISKEGEAAVSLSVRSTGLSSLPLAGLVLAVRPVLRKCAINIKPADADVVAMLEEVIGIYNRSFAPLSSQETVNLLESVGAALSVGASDALPINAAITEAASIAEKLAKFDNLIKPKSAYARPKSSVYAFEMLTEACRYAKSDTFKAIGFSIYAATKDNGKPVLNALNPGNANNGTAFHTDREDIVMMAQLAGSLPTSPESLWIYSANAISVAASFCNDFLLREGVSASALLDAAVEHVSRNANVLRRESAEGIENIALSLFASRACATHRLEGGGINAGIELSRRMQDHKDNPASMRIFGSALSIMVSQFSGEKTSIEISKNGVPYLRGDRHRQIGYFTNRIASMRTRLGSDFQNAENAALECFGIVVKNDGFGSNTALSKKLDALRKALYFNWIGSISEDTKGEMDGDTAAIERILKGAKGQSQNVFSLFVDSVSLVYGLGIHVEKVGSLISIAKNG